MVIICEQLQHFWVCFWWGSGFVIELFGGVNEGILSWDFESSLSYNLLQYVDVYYSSVRTPKWPTFGKSASYDLARSCTIWDKQYNHFFQDLDHSCLARIRHIPSYGQSICMRTKTCYIVRLQPKPCQR